MRRLFCVIVMIAWIWGCGESQAVRRASPTEIHQLMDLGRRVYHAPNLLETSAVGLADLASTRVYRIDYGHDNIVPTLIQFDTTQSTIVAVEEAAGFAGAWLSKHAEELGFVPEDLVAAEQFVVWLTDHVLAVNFTRKYSNLPVRDAFVQVNFAAQSDGNLRLREVVNRSHGHIRLENPHQKRPSRDELTEALADARLRLSSMQEVIYPVEGETLEVIMLRATEVLVHDEDEGVDATLTFVNGSLELIEAYRHRYAIKVGVQGSVMERSYLDQARISVPMPLTLVTGTSTRTDLDGQYEASLNPGDLVSFRLENARAVTLRSGTNTPYTIEGNFDAAQAKVVVAPEADGLVGLNAYMSVNRINAFARRHLRESEAPILGRSVRITTNVAGSCNAFYDGAISLFAAGDGCANLALVNDVTYHEWGHGLDDSTGRSRGITDGAFSEGIGDIIAAYFTNSSSMAPGFRQGDRRGIRDLNNTFRFPDNRGEVHQEGLTIGGAFWSLRKAMIERYGATRGAFLAERLFFRHLLVTDSYRESYQAVMTLDDDDANPATPSPNKCLITAAFAKHGLATEDPNCEDTPATSGDVSVEPSIALAVQSQAANGLVLMAAGPESARSMFACIGRDNECFTTKRGDLSFRLDGSKGNKVLFVSSTPILLVEQQTLTLFATDQNGNLLGKRSFAVHAK